MSNFLKGFAKKAVGSVAEQLGPIGGFLTPNLNSALNGNIRTPTTASFNDQDWRVRLSMPQVDSFTSSDILQPLLKTNGLVFPYTPTIIMSHSANYNALQPVHTNYPFYNYTNSSIDTMTITGDFFVENAVDAKYWIGALHYLRSVTKMFYGAGENLGAPPPVVRLNGYGDFVFNDVPVAITNFTVDLPADVDYIKTGIETGGIVDDFISPLITQPAPSSGNNTGWAPAQSQFAVTVQPMYSRTKVSEFNLNKFVNGDFIGKGYI